MTSIPGRNELAWYERSMVIELITGIAATAGMALASYQLLIDPAKRVYGYWALGAFLIAVIGFALRVWRGSSDDRQKINGISHDGIQGAIYVVHAAASFACGSSFEHGLKQIRATFHRVIYVNGSSGGPDPAEYEQVMDYVGRKGGGKGRKFPIGVGICSLAIRVGDPVAAERKNSNIVEYQRELVRDWGYSQAAAKIVSTEPMSWLASPIHDSDTDKVIGIVYLDSVVPGAFDSEPVKTAILTACLGVSRYVEKRYKS